VCDPRKTTTLILMQQKEEMKSVYITYLLNKLQNRHKTDHLCFAEIVTKQNILVLLNPHVEPGKNLVKQESYMVRPQRTRQALRARRKEVVLMRFMDELRLS